MKRRTRTHWLLLLTALLLGAVVYAELRRERTLGLDPAHATLELNGTILKFGTTDAIHGDRYVEIDGAIALVPDRFSARLFETPESELANPPAATGK